MWPAPGAPHGQWCADLVCPVETGQNRYAVGIRSDGLLRIGLRVRVGWKYRAHHHGGVLWAAVEWSETRQAWCIEDAEGHCLGHRDRIHGKEADKDATVMLPTAMIRDGRMPKPAEASRCRKDRLQRWRQRPSEQCRRRRRRERKGLLTAGWKAEQEEFSECRYTKA